MHSVPFIESLVTAFTSPSSLYRREYKIQLTQIDSKMILRLRQQPRPILATRKAHIELQQNPHRQRPQFHVRQILADAPKRPHRERRKGLRRLDHVWLGVPALWNKGVGGGVDAFVYAWCQFLAS